MIVRLASAHSRSHVRLPRGWLILSRYPHLSSQRAGVASVATTQLQSAGMEDVTVRATGHSVVGSEC